MKKPRIKDSRLFCVREAGLEPARLSALPPQDSASANFATPADSSLKWPKKAIREACK